MPGPKSKTLIVWIIALVIAASMASVFNEQLKSLAPYWEKLDWGWVMLVFAHTLLYRVVNASGWVWVVRALRWDMKMSTGVNLWLVSESCRWLPGSVWSMLSRVHLASRNGLTLTAGSVTVSIELLLTLIAWALATVIGLIASGAYHVITPYLHQLHWVLLALLLLIMLAGVSVWAIRWILRQNNKLSGKVRSLIEHLKVAYGRHPRYGMVAAVTLFYLLLCLYNGYIFWVILESLGIETTLSQAILANSLGWILGFLAVAIPGGIGVREAVIVAILSGQESLEVLAMAAILWRLIQIVSEVACLLPWGLQKFVRLIKRD